MALGTLESFHWIIVINIKAIGRKPILDSLHKNLSSYRLSYSFALPIATFFHNSAWVHLGRI